MAPAVPPSIIPTIGRVVLFRDEANVIRPAIITGVNGPLNVDLHVLGPIGRTIWPNVTEADPAQEPGCFPSWHWMPYQKQQAAAGTSIHAAPEHAKIVDDQKRKADAEWAEITGAAKPNTITAAHVADLIARSAFTDAKLGEKTTVVCMKLPNGYEIVEASSCVDPANYDHAMGVKISRERMVNRVWQLEGYRLQCELAKV